MTTLIYDTLVSELGDPFTNKRPAEPTPAQAKRERKKIHREQNKVTEEKTDEA